MRAHHWRRLIVFAMLVLSISQHAIADPMEDGQAAYNRGDFAAAQRLWRPLAEQGSARAQNNLGVMYENGKGVALNIPEALKWYRLAAAQGYAGAENNLALMYAIGRVVPRNPMRAYMWFTLAASSLSGEVGETVKTSRDVFATAMTSQQIATATEMARKCEASSFKDCESADEATATDGSPAVVSTPAVARTSHAVTIADYPVYSIRQHESGEVTLTYIVNGAGSVTTCWVLVTSGNMRLDDAACSLVKKRWKYTPATENGKPTSIQYISKVVFPPR